MLVIKSHSYYRRCKTKNRGRTVDAHFQHLVRRVSLSHFIIYVANTLFMTVCNLLPPTLPKILDQQSMILHWCSVPRSVRSHVSVCFDHQCGQYVEKTLWCTNFNAFRFVVAYLNVTIYVKPESWNRWLEPTDPTEQGKTCGLTGTGPGLAHQEWEGGVYGRVWNRTDTLLQSTPRQVVVYPNLLVTLNMQLFTVA